MAELKNTHGSLLAFVSSLSELMDIESVNLDAIADEVNLPQVDFVGIQGFSLTSANDYQPLPMTSGMITLATYNDTNNMLLIDRLDKVYELLQPNNLITFYCMKTGEQLGDLKLMGTTRVLPVTRNGTLAIQSITFQASLQYVE